MVQMRLKNSSTSNITTLYREVNGRMKYYKIKIYLTLFEEYFLIRDWVGVDNKRATGRKQSYFSSLSNLNNAIKKIVNLKSKRGYLQTFSQTIS